MLEWRDDGRARGNGVMKEMIQHEGKMMGVGEETMQ